MSNEILEQQAAPTIVLPSPPQKPAPTEFPIIASVAPVLASLVMWAVTQSTFALVFAFLGPVVAIGSLLDSRIHGRRFAKLERKRFSSEVQSTLDAIASGHDRERRIRIERAREPARLFGSASRDPEWWRDDFDNELTVCLGRGVVRSSLQLEGDNGEGRGTITDAKQSLDSLREEARRLPDAPITVDARQGIGVCGPRVATEAMARAIIVQLLSRLSPADARLTASGAAFDWLEAAPFTRITSTETNSTATNGADSGQTRVAFTSVPSETGGIRSAVCVLAATEQQLPRECRIVVTVDAGGSARVNVSSSLAESVEFRPHLVSQREASAFVELTAATAMAEGLWAGKSSIPVAVSVSSLPVLVADGNRLPASVGVGASGVLSLDLVADGPHAIIGGTTGSGKSELLVTWVLAMAASARPDAVNFLLVDFKGGSSFSAVSRLPHTVGVITDLDPASSIRALASLRAELRYRERALAQAGVRAIEELDATVSLPRLVIVVDEFAVVMNEFPELSALFGDLAARGRSLGVHLVLCTQRPGAAVRESVLANATLRLSLRVNNRTDSLAVIGTDAASQLPREPFGRCFVSVAGGAPEPVQVALSSTQDVIAVTERWSDWPGTLRKPWCDPLPNRVLAESLSPTARGMPFALIDLPDEQSQPTLSYDPGRDGNLLILGGHSSGRTGVLAALEAASEVAGHFMVSRVATDIEAAWDAVELALTSLAEPGSQTRLLLIDDIDSLLSRFSDDHEHVFLEMLARVMRDGPSLGVYVGLATGRFGSAIQNLATLCDSRLILRMPNRQEHVLAGGDSSQYDSKLPPGGGFWGGHRVQVALTAATKASQPEPQAEPTAFPAQPVLVAEDLVGIAIVTSRPQFVAERIRATSPGSAVVELSASTDPGAINVADAGNATLIGEPAAWQSLWGAFSAVKGTVPVILESCSVGDFRSVTGMRTLPPPIARPTTTAWMIRLDGSIGRVQLPELLTGQTRKIEAATGSTDIP